MKEKYIDIDSKKYLKPKNNLFHLGLIEYIIWFSIPFILIFAAVAMHLDAPEYKYDSELDELVPVESASNSEVPSWYIIVAISLFISWFIVGPICSYYGCITRPFLNRNKNIIKWNERYNIKMQIKAIKNNNIICSICGKMIPNTYDLCSYCGNKISLEAKQYTNIGLLIKAYKKQKGQRYAITGGVWLIIGLIITIATYTSDSPIYVVMWGAVIFGFIQMIYGLVLYATN